MSFEKQILIAFRNANFIASNKRCCSFLVVIKFWFDLASLSFVVVVVIVVVVRVRKTIYSLVFVARFFSKEKKSSILKKLLDQFRFKGQ